MSFLDHIPVLPLAPDDGTPQPFVAALTPEREAALLACAPRYPVFQFLGMTLEAVATDYARISLEHRLELTNPMGGLHGGFIATILDTAVGWAMASTLKQGFVVATVAMDTKFYKPLLRGRAIAEARITRKGRSVVYADVTVNDQTGAAIAAGSCIYMPVASTHHVAPGKAA